jgi:hypothetical protein
MEIGKQKSINFKILSSSILELVFSPDFQRDSNIFYLSPKVFVYPFRPSPSIRVEASEGAHDFFRDSLLTFSQTVSWGSELLTLLIRSLKIL